MLVQLDTVLMYALFPREREGGRERDSNSDSKTFFYKDRSLGSIKTCQTDKDRERDRERERHRERE